MSIWIEKYIDIDPHTRSGKKLTDVRKLVVHYTANNGASAENHYRYFNNLKDRYASAHIFVDKKEAICIIPLNEVAFHCGDVQKRNADGTAWRGVKELLPSGNYLSIGVEMCLEKDSSFHADTIERTEDVFVELCKKFKLDPLKDIVRHYDVTRKNCPAPWVKDEDKFVDFKKRVNAKLNGNKVEEHTPQATKPVEPKVETKSKEETRQNPVIRKGDKGDTVEEMQSLLNKYGYNLKVDGDFGQLSDSALRDFQENNNLLVDGICGQNSWNKLKSDNAVSKKKSTPKYPNTLFKVQSPMIHNDNVGLIQKQLNKLAGKTVVKVDNYYGEDTAAEVGKFQKKNGLVADEIVGKLTWDKLF